MILEASGNSIKLKVKKSFMKFYADGDEAVGIRNQILKDKCLKTRNICESRGVSPELSSTFLNKNSCW